MAAPAVSSGVPARRIADLTIGLLVFLGGFVTVEPAPYDLLLPAVILAWCFFGLRLNRHLLPLAVPLLLLLAGGVIALTQTEFFSKTVVKLATTALLAGSAIFYAALVAGDPGRWLRIIRSAYVWSALLAALLGIAGYFGVIPGAALFTKFGRAMGPFQDPNVFGPFLILPAIWLAQDVLTRPLRSGFLPMVSALVITFGVFLSGSRAAWGLTVLALAIVTLMAFINEPRSIRRLRMAAFVAAGAIAVLILLAVVLSIPSISNLIFERAQLVQEYDGGRLGRFERHVIGFFLVIEKPLGIGPFIFGLTFGEDEHNTWLKGFTVYGWLGGFAYLVLALSTLAAAIPLLFRPRPWRDMLVGTHAVFAGHLVFHFVIDQDSWRHLFLIYGILWGAIAAEKLRRRPTLPLPAPPPVPVYYAPLPRAG